MSSMSTKYSWMSDDEFLSIADTSIDADIAAEAIERLRKYQDVVFEHNREMIDLERDHAMEIDCLNDQIGMLEQEIEELEQLNECV